MHSMITLNGIEYIPASEAGPAAPTSRQIVVLQRGWIVVGDVSRDGDDLIIQNCASIRRWGTTTGLGQLARTGPTEKTIIDPQPDTRVHILAVVQRINVLSAL